SGGTSLCLGIILFQKLRLGLKGVEYFALAFIAGAACFSEIVFLLCSVGLAYRAVFLGVAAAAAIGAISLTGKMETRPLLSSLPRRISLPALLFLMFGMVYLVNALAPEMSPDGAAYHLPFIDRYLRAHRFEAIPTNFYASFPQGIELLFLP